MNRGLEATRKVVRRSAVAHRYPLFADHETVPRIIMGMKLRRPELELDLTMGSNQMLLDMLEDDALDAILIATNEGSSIIPLSTWCRCLRTIFFSPPRRPNGWMPHGSPICAITPTVKFVSLAEGFATYAGFREAFSTSPASSRRSSPGE